MTSPHTFQSVSIPDTEVHPIHSTIVNDDFELWIARPQAGFIPTPAEPPKVLFVLDANLCFGTVVETTRLMHKLYGELPPLLVLGIAYPTEDSFLQGRLRNRDFTPSEDNRFDEMAATFTPPTPVRSVEPAMGGADAFLRFLEEEVKPYVAARFEFSQSKTTVFGSSLGGLLVTYASLQRPEMFSHFIAASPSLWWDNEMMFEIEPNSAPCGTQLFLTAGGLEESPEIPMLAQFKMLTNMERMAERLREKTLAETLSMEVMSVILPDETHTSVIPVALTRGLRSCFGRK